MITSAGGLISIKHEEETFVLLLQYKNGRLAFPKGRVDLGETIEEAAVREVEEETGLISPKILQKLGEVSYVSDNIHQKMHQKVMHIFLMQGNTMREEREDNAGWYPLAKAKVEMKLPGERALLEKYADLLGSHLSNNELFLSLPKF